MSLFPLSGSLLRDLKFYARPKEVSTTWRGDCSSSLPLEEETAPLLYHLKRRLLLFSTVAIPRWVEQREDRKEVKKTEDSKYMKERRRWLWKRSWIENENENEKGRRKRMRRTRKIFVRPRSWVNLAEFVGGGWQLFLYLSAFFAYSHTPAINAFNLKKGYAISLYTKRIPVPPERCVFISFSF